MWEVTEAIITKLYTPDIKDSDITAARQLVEIMAQLSFGGRYPSDDETFVKFPSRRSVVHSTKGIVSTTSPLATEAGLQILRDGGNAAVRGAPPPPPTLQRRRKRPGIHITDRTRTGCSNSSSSCAKPRGPIHDRYRRRRILFVLRRMDEAGACPEWLGEVSQQGHCG